MCIYISIYILGGGFSGAPGGQRKEGSPTGFATAFSS